MLVSDIMSTSPVTARAGCGIRTALRLLAAHRVTALPVVDVEHRIVGVVSEFDLIRGRIHRDSRFGDGASEALEEVSTGPPPAVVADVMTHVTVVVNPGTDLFEVGRILASTGIKSIPVVDAGDRVVGIVSRSDVVRALARDDDQLEEDLTDALTTAGLARCHVVVRNGVVRIDGPGAETEELSRARAIVRAMPGATLMDGR